MKIRLAQTSDDPELHMLIGQFRVALAELRGVDKTLDVAAAAEELIEYQDQNYPIYVAEDDGNKLIGYLVCRVDENVVWVESLFVLPAHRREGIGAALYRAAENLAEELGSDTLYNWVDPDNEKIIRFLQKRGYNVLNLIELRRPRMGEELPKKIQVGTNTFSYR